MPYYSNPRETHPIDEAISVANNKMFYVHQLADSRGIIIDPFGSSSSSAANSSDAFGRMKAAMPFTLGDYKHFPEVDFNFNNSTVNGGDIVTNIAEASVTLSTTNNSAAYAIHQTKYYHPYQPGKSQEIFTSFVFKTPVSNVTKRIGYFDDLNGIFVEQTGTGELAFVIRSSATGTTQDARIVRSSWSLDKCDGTGQSGFDLDVTKTQLLYMDFQWLGVGKVRFGFVHEGAIVIAHEVNHSNILDMVYMTNPSLPIRSEIRNVGTTVGGSFDHICSTVISSGGYSETGVDFAAANSTARTTSTPGGTPFPVMAIRLKNSFKGSPNRASARINGVSLSVQTESILYKLVKVNSVSALTFSGAAVWTSADSDSAVEYCVNAETFTGGSTLSAGFIPAGSSQNSLSPGTFGDISGSKKSIIMQNIDSTDSEIYVISAQTVSTQPNAQASVSVAVQWRETY